VLVSPCATRQGSFRLECAAGSEEARIMLVRNLTAALTLVIWSATPGQEPISDGITSVLGGGPRVAWFEKSGTVWVTDGTPRCRQVRVASVSGVGWKRRLACRDRGESDVVARGGRRVD